MKLSFFGLIVFDLQSLIFSKVYVVMSSDVEYGSREGSAATDLDLEADVDAVSKSL